MLSKQLSQNKEIAFRSCLVRSLSPKVTSIGFISVQNLSELMLAHRDHNRYVKWSLDNLTLNILRPAFPDRDVLVVRPSRFERATFSCFDNFVQSNWNGAPTHVKDPGHLESLAQLRGIISSCQDLLCLDGLSESGNLRDSRLTLIGFSKGVVVLNQV